MLFVKSASIMGAASLISMGAAAASEPDDLFAAGLLELNEKPMTANELGEARGGFSFGGLDFNIGVQVLPPTFNPLPDGPFGASGGPFGSNGGPFGQNGGPFGNNGNHNNNASQNNAPSAPQPVAQNTPAASTQQPAAQPTTVASATPSAPPPTTSAPAAPASSPTPAAATTTPTPSPAATNTTTTSTPPATVATTPPAPTSGNNNTQTASNSAPAPSTPYTPLPTSGSSPAGASQSSQGSSSSTTPPPEISSTPTNPIPVPASERKNQYSTPLTMSVLPGNGGGAQNSSPDAQPTTMSATMRDIDDRAGVRGIESNGLSSVVNNTLNNVFISQEVVMNVQVTNYDFAMSMRRVSNVTSQAVSQSFFLPGLN